MTPAVGAAALGKRGAAGGRLPAYGTGDALGEVGRA